MRLSLTRALSLLTSAIPSIEKRVMLTRLHLWASLCLVARHATFEGLLLCLQ